MEFQELAQRVASALETERSIHFAVGDLLAGELPDTRGAAKALASEIGQSASWVSEHLRTAKRIPPEHRAPDMPWGIHVICARTDDPLRWLSLAVQEQLSIRQLRERITGETKVRTPEPKKCCADLLAQRDEARALADQLAQVFKNDGSPYALPGELEAIAAYEARSWK